MKTLVEFINESQTSNKEIRHYVESWLKQDRNNYEATITVILESMMDFFKNEIDYYDNKENVASGKQSKEYNDAVELYAKVRKAYQEWDN